MEIKPIRKKYTFNLEKVLNKRSNPKKIANQSTLIGAYFKLMMNQKLVVALVRVKSNTKDYVIPICFKAEEKMIPTNVQLLKIHQNNMVKVSIPGLDSIHAILVVVADDSRDMCESYRVFVSEAKNLKIYNLQEKISNWFTIENIVIEKVKLKSLPALSIDEFEDIAQHVSSQRRKESKQANIRKFDTEKPGPSKKAKTTAKESVPEIIDLESKHSDSPKASKDIDLEKFLDETDLVPLYELATQIPYETTKKFAFGLMKVLGKITKELKAKSVRGETIPADYSVVKGNEFKKIRIIPDSDKTYEKDSVTYIEGILPVNARKYRQAFKGKHPKNTELEPTAILNNIVKSTFPKHWAIGVTLRGAGGNKSLISLWNYSNPLSNPCGGTFENNLGEMRFRALLDHAMRKAGKHSYDKTIEKSLISSFSKSLHYCRKQFGPVKDEDSDDSEEENTSDSDVSDDSEDRDFVPRIPLKATEVYDESSEEKDDHPFDFSKTQEEESGSDQDQDQDQDQDKDQDQDQDQDKDQDQDQDKTLPLLADEDEDNLRRGFSQYLTGQKLREKDQKDTNKSNVSIRTQIVDIQVHEDDNTPDDSGLGSNAESSFSKNIKISSSQKSGKRRLESKETIEEKKKRLTSTPIYSSFDKSQSQEKIFSSPKLDSSPICKKDSPVNLSGSSQVVKSAFGKNISERFSKQLLDIREEYQSRLAEEMNSAEKEYVQDEQNKSGEDNTRDNDVRLTEQEKALLAKISGKMNIDQILANL